MELGDVWVKIANNQRLTAQELDFLRGAGRETQLRNTFISGNTNPDNTLKFAFPFQVIYSETFQKDTASISIDIPAGFRNIIVFSNGRSTTATTGAEALHARYNFDSGANYENQVIYGIGSTIGTQTSSTTTYAVVGGLSRDGETSGLCGSGFLSIPNYNSSFYKSAQALITPGALTNIFIESSVWKNTSPIRNIQFSSSADNIKAGSTISIYGIL